MNDATNLSRCELPIACNLSEQELVKRRQEIAEDIFRGVQQTSELSDGYAFRFAGDGSWAARLLEFVTFERECCPFLTFELLFEPGRGPIWLRLRGSGDVKEFIRGVFEVQRRDTEATQRSTEA